MARRFYAPSLQPSLQPVTLPDDEGAHLVRVLRLKPGDTVRVFDGRGLECSARIASVARDRVVVEPTGVVDAVAETRVAMTLGQAVLKADKMDDVVRDAVMLGAAAIQPLRSAHTDVPPEALRRQARVERWQRVAVSSAKQCGRAVVPEVHPVCTLEACLAGDESDLRVMLVEPSAGFAAQGLTSIRQLASPASALVLVGPEGGWADEELALARAARVLLITLGARTLRADAAPLVAITALLAAFGEFDGTSRGGM
jgi:16S rRNA (uracil1498-N3)-methyltransferase